MSLHAMAARRHSTQENGNGKRSAKQQDGQKTKKGHITAQTGVG
jgi:hypothetical protein